MKKNLFLVSCLLFSSILVAQTHEDALFFSDNNLVGTARSSAMGNAFGALGADVASISINPAGLGVYNSYDFSVTTNLGMREMTSYFQGNKTVDAAGNFNLSSLGFVLPYKINKEGDWRRTNMAFTYNKTNIFKSNTTIKGYNRYWVIDGHLRVRRVRDDERTGTVELVRELRDVSARLRQMDSLGVDIQVLYPSLFLSQVSGRPEVELALCKAYNRWMADKWQEGEGRLRWVAPLPLMTMSAALEESPAD